MALTIFLVLDFFLMLEPWHDIFWRSRPCSILSCAENQPSVLIYLSVSYRVFSRDVMAAMLMYF